MNTLRPAEALSFQLYSARALGPLEKQFELIAELGYRRVEAYGGLLADPLRLKMLLHRYEIAMPTTHAPLDRLRNDPGEVARICRDLGVETIFAPAPPLDERDQGAEGWRALGQQLARLGSEMFDEGLKLGWHNHHWEYGRASNGETFLDILFGAAPDLLWEADIAWIVRGRADPVAELERHGHRVEAVHVKDLAPRGQAIDEDGWADPGHGTIDWVRMRSAIERSHCRYLVVEHDKPSDVVRFARRARETVESWQ